MQNVSAEQQQLYWQQVFIKHRTRVVNALVKLGLRRVDAEESASYAFAKGLEWSKESRETPRNAAAWLTTVALNAFRTALRKKGREIYCGLHPGEKKSLDPGFEADMRNTDYLQKLCICISDSDTQLLQDFYVEGYTSKELANKRGTGAIAVRVQVIRLKGKIRERAEFLAKSRL